MGDADVIKEFLVSLGFKIDDASQKTFVNAIGAATVQAVDLGAAVAGAAAAVVAGVAKISDSLEQLYFASLRSKASVENIQALDFAARQLGATARDSIENLGRFLRSSPGAAGWLHNLGVETQGANGQLRDTGDILTDLGTKFRQMPYYKAKAYADFLGIDERTLMALQQGLGEFSDQYKEMLKLAGVDSQSAAKSAHAFMNELRLLFASFGVLWQKISAQLSGGLAADIRRFRDLVVANFGKISDIIVTVSRILLSLGDILSTVVLRMYEGLKWLIHWFDGLSDSTKDLVKDIGLIVIAWRTLNLAISASPMGRILQLAAALGLLVDDYVVWKNGGKSLIDWSQWSKEIDKAIDGIDRLASAVENLWDRIKPAWDKISPLLDVMGKGQAKGQANESNVMIDFLTGNWSKKVTPADVVTNPLFDALTGTATPSRGVRNNNPGNLNFADQPGASRENGTGRFASFRTPQEGLAALANQLKIYGTRGLHSLSSIIGTYSPASENGVANTQAYINDMVQQLGIDPDTEIDQNSDPAALAALMRGIVTHENGKNPYSAEMINEAAGLQPVGQSSGVSMSQKTDIHVYGGGEIRKTAAEVAREQDGVNQRLVRNLKGAVQ